MCVAIPARITGIAPGALPMAHAQQGDKVIECCLAYLPEAVPGDYVLVQHGFAVQLLDEESAAESLAAFEQLGVGALAS